LNAVAAAAVAVVIVVVVVVVVVVSHASLPIVYTGMNAVCEGGIEMRLLLLLLLLFVCYFTKYWIRKAFKELK